MAYISQYQYYENGGANPQDENWGSYQYVSLEDIVNNFMLMYTGNHSIVNNEERYKVLFHAKRAIQELNYDAFKEIKILELSVCDTLRYVLPSDYVNWVRISMYKNGLLYPLSENIQTNWSSAYLQDNECRILFDLDGNALSPQDSTIDFERIYGGKRSIYLNQNSPYNNMEGYCYDGGWYFEYGINANYGLNTETANANPTFKINPKGGVINFSSGMANELCVLEYVSDGMENGKDSLITVNKLFEDYIYAAIEFAILGSKVGVQEYIVTRLRKKRTALLRNAKIRISNIHPGRLLQNLRGRDKWLK
jgi:ABC-type antimicrobial peptide transport system permease subunit|tara:strand:+ start:729 stop:1652 length:924 start_codon:yes stop_codon:yes gene_type:complete